MAEMKVRQMGGFEFVEEGEGPDLVLLHGLFGALSNWKQVFQAFSGQYRVIIPLMPIYSRSKFEASVEGMADFVAAFLRARGIEEATFLGNSLGGHIALLLALRYPENVRALVLTGSSGLYEAGMGNSFPRRGNRAFIKERIQYTFFDPGFADDVLVDEVFEIVNNNFKALRILKIARAAQRQNLHDEIVNIQAPVLLIWGLNDNITPANVGHEFHALLPQSELRFIDHCGHAPMMERPKQFNQHVERFLKRIEGE